MDKFTILQAYQAGDLSTDDAKALLQAYRAKALLTAVSQHKEHAQNGHNGQTKHNGHNAVNSAIERQPVEQAIDAQSMSEDTAKNRAENRTDDLPLSEGQRGLWLLQQLAPGMSAYNVPLALRVRQTLDPATVNRWQQACTYLLLQYPILQTRVSTIDGEPRQHVDSTGRLAFTQENLQHLAADELMPYLQRQAQLPFDLEAGPLVRVGLYQDAQRSYSLLLTVHHLIADGLSLILLLQRLLANYTDLLRGDLPDGTVQTTYRDFVAWEQAYLADTAAAKDRAYWQQQLAPSLPQLALPQLTLPLDRPRPAQQRFRGEVYTIVLHRELGTAVRELAKQQRVSPATLLMATFKLLLYRYTGQHDLIIGVPSIGRPQSRFTDVVGYFVNMLVMRSQLDEATTFADYVQTLHQHTIDALDHSAYPFPRLVADLALTRDMAVTPLFQVAFAFQNYGSLADVQEAVADLLPMEILTELHQAGEFDLELEVIQCGSDENQRFYLTSNSNSHAEPRIETEMGYQLHFKYNPDLFDESTIARMATHYGNLLTAVLAAPQQAMAGYELLGADEKAMILDTWNATAAAYPREKTFLDLFAEQVTQTPDAIALRVGTETLSYTALQERSDSLAVHLRMRGVVSETCVAICVERSVEMVVGILAIWKAGGAYVPLEPDYPNERLAYMLTDSGVTHLLTQAKFNDQLSALTADGCKLLLLDDDAEWDEMRGEHCMEPIPNSMDAGRLAYVFYTSGSTGKPKGVMIEHRSLTNFLVSMSKRPGFTAGESLLAVTTYCFDISLLELFLPLTVGGKTIIVPTEISRNADRLRQTIAHHRPNLIQATPSTWLMLFASGWQNEEDVTILCGGEALSESLRLQFAATGSRVWNMFGPTETTIWSSIKAIHAAEPITIGHPIHNTQMYILDRHQQPVPIGVTGDLYIAGDGLARGYLNRPELSAERFVENPFVAGAKMYRTGDLARWLPSGEIEFLGRVDHQVKIRGFRIELGEIERVLSQHADVREAVVVDQINKHGERYLCAYYIATQPQTEQALRAHLAQFLPLYMVPAEFIAVERMPLNTSGKIDRNVLVAENISSANQAPTVNLPAVNPPAVRASQTMLERMIASVWQDVLDRPTIPPGARFFEIGGTSLLIVKVHAQLKAQLAAHLGMDADLELTTLFQYPTVRELAFHLATSFELPSAMEEDRAQTNTTSVATSRVSTDKPLPPAYADAVAIIGIACRFPDADDYRSFWQNLVQGHESIRVFTGEELAELDLPAELTAQPNFVGCRSTIAGANHFDAAFFQLSRHNATLMDPQARLLLEQSWAAIEDAGYTPDQIAETGVFMSSANRGLPPAATEPTEQYMAWMMGQGGTLPTTISYRLGFRGPSLFIHSNCSSSLTALQVAAQNLRLGECKQALIGACSLHGMAGYLHQPGLNFSSDGHCRAFDAAADGMVMGEGVGVILIKPLAAAVQDGDHIYAMIRGVGVNNDSADKVGYYAPGIQGQSAVIQQTLQRSDVHPATIGYVEAHGTGTTLGDPIEVAALTQAYRTQTAKVQYCALGSVKTNIGHLDTAAGMAGLIKATLALTHRVIPPTLNFAEPNPQIDFKQSPFYVITEPTPWSAADHPRRAAVSSLGVGGTNAHLILEEYIPAPRPMTTDGPYIIPLSAKTPERLLPYAQKLRSFLQDATDELALAAVAYTLQTGRVSMAHRVAFVVQSRAELFEQLTNLCAAWDAQDTSTADYDYGQAKANQTTTGQTTVLQPLVGPRLVDEEETEALVALWLAKGNMEKLAELWVSGAAVDWQLLYRTGQPQRVSLPTYPFAPDRYATNTPATATTITAALQRMHSPQPVLPQEPEPFTHSAETPMLLPPLPTAFETMSPVLKTQPATEPAASPLDTHQFVAEVVRAKLAAILYIRADEVDLQSRFVDVGLDSILAVQFVNELNDALAIHLQASKIYEYTAAGELIEYLMTLVDENQVPPKETAAPSPWENDGGKNDSGKNDGNLAYWPKLRTGQLDKDDSITEHYVFNAAHNPSLRDHIIYGQSMMPFDGYLELIAGGIHRIFATATLHFQDVHIVNPLIARPDEAISLAVDYRRIDPDMLAVRITSASASDTSALDTSASRLHLKGRVQAVDLPPAMQGRINDQYKPYLDHYDRLYTGADLYHGTSHFGQPGPFYHTIESLKVTDQVAVSTLRLSPEAQAWPGEFFVHPALVNGFLLSALNFAWHVNPTPLSSGEGVFLPILIDQVLIYASLRNERYTSLICVREREADWITFDADLIDEADRVAIAFRGLRVKCIAAGDFDPVPHPSHERSMRRRHVQHGSDVRKSTVPAGRGTSMEEFEHDTIAVIGMAGKFPGAGNLQEFWINLANGVNSITEVPAERWSLAEHYAPGELQPNKTYHKWGGFLDDYDRFDPTFFNISPMEAEQMDPQQRLFLQACWSALEDAGYAPPALSHLRCGVFVGATMSDYGMLLSEAGLANTAQAFMGSSSAILTSRISYLLNLKGPSIALDTACSSSLVAIHQACESLRHGECEMVLAGGVTLSFTPQYHIKGAHARILSPTGGCRPFDSAANGVTWGEGVGVVVLKPYAAALHDGDSIYGLIRGSGVNQDGQTNGITAPNGRSQRELELEVYAKAGINPATIGYVEAHGTGTKLGDPIEVDALTEAFREYTDKIGYCALGSVKGNIGHTTMASGVAGLIKVLLSFQHRQIAPSINFDHPNEHINFADSPFFVNTRLRTWEPIDHAPRRAALSSFGFGGTNCHLVLEEAPPSQVNPETETPQLILLSAKNPECLQAAAELLLDFVNDAVTIRPPQSPMTEATLLTLVADLLQVTPAEIDPQQPLVDYGLDPVHLHQLRQRLDEHFVATMPPTLSPETTLVSLAHSLAAPSVEYSDSRPDFSLREMAYTLQIGREAMAHRLAFVARDLDEVCDILHSYLVGHPHTQLYQGEVRKKGQVAAEQLERAITRQDLPHLAELWTQGANVDWAQLQRQEPPRRIHLPTYPFAKERYWIPGWKQLATTVLHPLLQRAVAGATEPTYESTFTGDEFFLADHIVRGHKTLPGVAYLEMARAAGQAAMPDEQIVELRDIIWMRPLLVGDVPVAVQTMLQQEGMQSLRYQISQRNAAGEAISCAGGTLVYGTPPAATSVDLDAIRNRCPQRKSKADCYALFADKGVDYGPAFQVIEALWHNETEVLTQLQLPATVRADATQYTLHPSLLDGALHSLVGLINASLADDVPLYMPYTIKHMALIRPLPDQCYVHLQLVPPNDAVAPNGRAPSAVAHFNLLLLDETGKICISIDDFAVKVIPQTTASPAAAKQTTVKHEPARDLYYQPYWNAQPLPATQAGPLTGRLLIVLPALPANDVTLAGVREQLHKQYAQTDSLPDPLIAVPGTRTAQLETTTWTVDLHDPQRAAQWLRTLPPIDHIYFFAGQNNGAFSLTDVTTLDVAQEQGAIALFRLIKALEHEGTLYKLSSFKVITVGTQWVDPKERVQPWGATLVGLTMSLAREYPALNVSCVDLAPPAPGTTMTSTITTTDIAAIVAEQDRNEHLIALRNGTRYVRQLAPLQLPQPAQLPYRQGSVYLILGGMGGIGQELSLYLARTVGAKVVLVGRSALTPAQMATLERIRVAGGDYLYCRADGTDLAAMAAVVAQAKAHFGAIHGAIHSALVLHDAALNRMEEATLRAVLAPKVRASAVFAAVLQNEPLDFLAFFSSAQSFRGDAGQSNYAAGGTFQDAFAVALSQQAPYPVKLINWGIWGEVGVVATEHYRQRLREQGVLPLTVEEGLAAFTRLLAAPATQVAVLKLTEEALGALGIPPVQQSAVAATAAAVDFSTLVAQIEADAAILLA